MTSNITNLTNATIPFMTDQHTSWNDSIKFSYINLTTCEEIQALFGLMYIKMYTT